MRYKSPFLESDVSLVTSDVKLVSELYRLNCISLGDIAKLPFSTIIHSKVIIRHWDEFTKIVYKLYTYYQREGK